jgi:hypothetical protein
VSGLLDPETGRRPRGFGVGRARHGIGGLARRIRPVGRLAVGNLPDGRGHLVATGGHLQRQVLHLLRFDPAFAGAVPCPVAMYYALFPNSSLSVHLLDGPAALPPPGAVQAQAPHVPAYLVGFQDDRRQLLDIFAQHTSRNELLSTVSAAFARLANWEYQAVWGETFRSALALANVEFLRGSAGCARRTRRSRTGDRPRVRCRGRSAHHGRARRVCRSR